MVFVRWILRNLDFNSSDEGTIYMLISVDVVYSYGAVSSQMVGYVIFESS